MNYLQLKILRVLFSVGKCLLKVHNQSHSFLEFIVQELEYFTDIFADRHPLPFIIEDCRNILLGFHHLLLMFGLIEWDKREEYRQDIFDVHKSFFGRHIKASFLLNRIVGILHDQFLIYLGFSLLVDFSKAVHLIVFFRFLFVVHMLVYYIGNPISEIDEIANYQQLYDMLVELLVNKIFLEGPVENKGRCLLEVKFLVVDRIVLEQLIDKDLLIEKLLHLMELLITSQYSNVVEYKLGRTMDLYHQLL